jgi:flagellar biosynthetic protein FliP
MPDAAAIASNFLNSSDANLSAVKWVVLAGVLSLAPALAVMTTSFVRISVVLGILRHGFGGGQFLPAQALTALSLFLTVGVMAPVWRAAYDAGIAPFTRQEFETKAEQQQAFTQAVKQTLIPIRKFMALQIEAAGNAAAIDLLLSYQSKWPGAADAPPEFYEDLPVSVLLPAYVLSELKIAFAIGFQLLLPFVVIDFVVASVINSIGLTSMPATWISFPLKLLLFVLVDGWFLTVETLLGSIRPFTG